MKMYKTRNYSFPRILGNRPVSKLHVLDLIKKIKDNNLLEHYPIVVTKDGFLVDGQHRLEAAKKEGLELTVTTINKNVNDIIVALVNSSQLSWSMDDYINFYAERAEEQYMFLKQLRDKHKVTANSLIKLFNSRINGVVVKEGHMTLYSTPEEKDLLLELLNQYLSLREILIKPVWQDQEFIKALKIMFKQFDAEKILAVIERSKKPIEAQEKVKDYLRVFEGLFNKNKRVNFTRFF